MTSEIDEYIAAAADPEQAEIRFNAMLEDRSTRERVEKLSGPVCGDLIHLISVSRFLYHFICQHPDSLEALQPEPGLTALPEKTSDPESLRKHKYTELLKISWLDITRACDYDRVLRSLSSLADSIVNAVLYASVKDDCKGLIEDELCVFALGKLGAIELNYSSDIDLIFMTADAEESRYEIYDLQQYAMDTVRRFSRLMEDNQAGSFLYRVDLKLRPWGNSGPLFMSIDETEAYYEASSDAWERFAWLRGRHVAGSARLSNDFLQRLNPFIYKRSLSTEDLQRFVDIKNEMSRVRRRRGCWNVKLGEGGIRDIEFFVQTLQIVNAGQHAELQSTNTLEVIAGLVNTGLLEESEAQEIRQSYLFLRRLENHLQMVDERQTHELSDDEAQRLFVARSMRVSGESRDEIMENFETTLFASQSIAKYHFERILPAEGT